MSSPAVTATIARDRLTAGLDVILTWFRLTKKDDSVFTAATTTIADAADVEDGYKPPILATIEDISVGLSDDFGRMQATTLVVEISDVVRDEATGAPIRGWLGAGDTLRNCVAELKLTTDAQRRAGGITPMQIFIGKIQRYSGSVGSGRSFTVRFECTGWINPLLNQPLITRTVGQSFPAAPAASQSRLAPFGLGISSDDTTSDTPPAPAAETSSGATVDVTGFGHLSGTPVGSGVSLTDDGPGGGTIASGTKIRAYVVAKWAATGRTDPSPFFEAGVELTIGADGSSATLAWTDAGADSYEAYFAGVFSGLTKWSQRIDVAFGGTSAQITDINDPTTEPDLTTITSGAVPIHNPVTWYLKRLAVMPSGVTALGGLVTAAAWPYPRPNRFITTPVSGATAYVDYRENDAVGGFVFKHAVSASNINGDGNIYTEYMMGDLATGWETVSGPPIPKGMIPGIPIGPITDVNGTTWPCGVAFDAHACDVVTKAPSLFLSASDGNIYPVDPVQYGLTVWVPGQSGWSTLFGSDLFFTSPTDSTRWMIAVLSPAFSVGLPDDNPAANILAGTNVLRANLCHAENVGDASGTVVEDGFDQLALVLDNLALPAPEDRILGTADWTASIPTFPSGAPMRDADSWTLAKANYDAVITTSDRTRARWYAEPITIGDFLAEQLVGLFAKGCTALNGQFQIVVLNPLETPADEVTDQRDIEQNSFGFADSDQGYANALPYTSGQSYDPSGALTLTESGEAEDATSQDSDHNDERVEASALALSTVISSTQAADVMAQRLAWSKDLVRTVDVASALHWLLIRIGSIVPITHREGLDTDGWDGRLTQCLGLRVSMSSGLVAMTALDVHTKLATTTTPDDVIAFESDATVTLSAAVTSLVTVDQGTVTFTLTDEDDNPVGSPVTAPVVFGEASVTVSLASLIGDRMLTETGDRLLLETGDEIVL